MVLLLEKRKPLPSQHLSPKHWQHCLRCYRAALCPAQRQEEWRLARVKRPEKHLWLSIYNIDVGFPPQTVNRGTRTGQDRSGALRSVLKQQPWLEGNKAKTNLNLRPDNCKTLWCESRVKGTWFHSTNPKFLSVLLPLNPSADTKVLFPVDNMSESWCQSWVFSSQCILWVLITFLCCIFYCPPELCQNKNVVLCTVQFQ